MNLLVAVALGNAIASGFLPGRQMSEGGNQALDFEVGQILFAQGISRLRSAMLQNPRIFLRIDGESMFMVSNVEFAALLTKNKLQFAALQHSTVVIVQHRNQHFSMKFLFQWLPIDIKEIGVDRRFSIFEHIEPPGIIAAHYSHVIGNDIENQSHASLMKRGDEAVEMFGRANFRIEGVVIDDIVPMHTARTSLKAGRDIAVANTDVGKIRDDFSRLIEREVTIQLKAVSRHWHVRARCHDSSDHTTDHGANSPGSREAGSATTP